MQATKSNSTEIETPIVRASEILSAAEQSLLGTHDHPMHPGNQDWQIIIEAAPVIGLIARTNGDPLPQEGNEEVWENLMETYGLTK